MDDTTIQLITQVGVPAGIGVVCVAYLIKVLIPKQMETIDRQAAQFQQALQSQQAAFDTALRLEAEVHREMLGVVTQTVRDQALATRETLNELNHSTKDLTKAVYKLYGHSGLNGDRT